MIVLGADCSTSYSNPPTPEQAALWMQLGLRLMVVGTSWRAGSHLDVWGQYVPVQEYQFPEAIHSTPLDWWVDAETPTATQAAIRRSMNKGAIGVYTRRGWWQENLPTWNVKVEYGDAKLWDARYVHGDGFCLIQDALNTGDIDKVKRAIAAEQAATPPFKPYGGFDKADMTQWHNSIVIFGINVDLNFFEVEDEEDEVVQPKLVWDVVRQRAYLIGTNGELRWITDPRDLALLESQYGKMVAIP